jgi:hypothetical protein
MFQHLLGDIRAAVIGRVFLYQPRTAPRPVEAAPDPGSGSVSPAAGQPSAPPPSAEKKRKRHRH